MWITMWTSEKLPYFKRSGITRKIVCITTYQRKNTSPQQEIHYKKIVISNY
jgi:hypothetical protein